MLKKIVFIVSLFFSGNVLAQYTYDLSEIIKNAKGMCDFVSINIESILNSRTPGLHDICFASKRVTSPSVCFDSLNNLLLQKINTYKQQDINNFQTIINSYCSHVKGWAEYKPGTCSAGGPPPICTAEHWYKNPNAINDYFKENEKIKKQRLAELEVYKKYVMEEACRCWLAEIKNYSLKFKTKNTSKSNLTNKTTSSSGLKIPCNNAAACPIGFKCVGGFCIESTSVSISSNDIIYLSEKDISEIMRDIYLHDIWSYVQKNFNALRHLIDFYDCNNKVSNYTIKQNYDPTLIGMYMSMYQKELYLVRTNFNFLETTYREYQYSKAEESKKQLMNDIIMKRKELIQNVFNLNAAAYEIEKKIELGKCNCYNVLYFNNTLITDVLNKYINISLD